MKLTFVLAGLAFAATTVLGEQYKSWGYRNELTTGPVDAQFTQTKELVDQSLDIPRVFPRPNSTSFDWWYFDAVNPKNLNESVVIVFYLATNDSFPLRLTTNNSVSADVFLNFGDGSAAQFLIDSAAPKNAKDYAAIITTDGGPGISASWVSAGVRLTGLSDGKQFRIDVDSPVFGGVKGHLIIKSSAPSHYPCSLKAKVGETLEAVSHVGWTNISPDAVAEAHFDSSFAGTKAKLHFTDGVGYHDQKWGDRPFQRSVKDYFWGHARLGPYSIVWLHSTTHEGKTYSNTYIYHPNGASRTHCANDAFGGEKPTILSIENSASVTIFTFRFANMRVFGMKAEKTRILGQRGPFARYSGKVTTTTDDGFKLEGTAFFQEFHF